MELTVSPSPPLQQLSGSRGYSACVRNAGDRRFYHYTPNATYQLPSEESDLASLKSILCSGDACVLFYAKREVRNTESSLLLFYRSLPPLASLTRRINPHSRPPPPKPKPAHHDASFSQLASSPQTTPHIDRHRHHTTPPVNGPVQFEERAPSPVCAPLHTHTHTRTWLCARTLKIGW
jgi:hypothetical protein